MRIHYQKGHPMKSLSAVLFSTALFLSAAAFADVPEYTVMKTDGGIVLDGVLNEADWAKAKTFGDFAFPWWTAGEKEQTEAKMLWSDDYLYIAFRCSDKNIWADHYSTNDWTYNDDCAELFWFPGTETINKYYTFEINCLGNLLSVSKNPDYPITDRHSRIMVPRIAQTIEGSVNADGDTDTAWVLEVAVKFTDYPEFGTVKPSEGVIWRAGLNRCGGKTNAQYSQWSASQTTKPNFHVPADFGRLVFSEAKVGSDVGVDKRGDAAGPELIKLAGCYPNPFNASTAIAFSLAGEEHVTLDIYSIADQKVMTLVDERLGAGDHRVVWNGTNDDGRTVASGIYLMRLKAGASEVSGRMTFLK